MRRSRGCAVKSERSNAPSGGSNLTNIMSTIGRSGSTCGSCSRRSAPSCSIAMPTKRLHFLDFTFDRLTFDEVRRRLEAVRVTTPYGYVVTPNVDHVVRVHREPQLRDLYEAADLC